MLADKSYNAYQEAKTSAEKVILGLIPNCGWDGQTIFGKRNGLPRVPERSHQTRHSGGEAGLQPRGPEAQAGGFDRGVRGVPRQATCGTKKPVR